MSYNTLASQDIIKKTITAVNSRGISAEYVATKEEALERVKSIIPAGSEVMTASSVTLTQIGFDDLLISKNHPWNNIKEKIIAEKDPAKVYALRKQSTLSDYFLGSVHAIAETGEMVIASATGSQLPSYIFSSSHVIWVAGAQKITKTLEEGIKRMKEYVFPLVDQQVKLLRPGSGSMIGKTVIFEREAPILQRKLTLIIVNEVLGF